MSVLVEHRIDPRSLRRGQLYVASSSTAGYGSLLAAVALGAAVRVGDHASPGAVDLVAVRGTGRASNPEIGFTPEWFQRVLQDYQDWKQGWWREAIQNSVDAGAKHITCEVFEQSDGTWLVSAEDDGRGMTREVLFEKFLQFGGTTKTAGTGTGGFGAAKELLILPWLRWYIATSDVVVQGSAKTYEVLDAPMRKGVRIEVVMAADQATTIAPAIAFIEKCYLPNVKFRCVQSTKLGHQQIVEPKARLAARDPIEEIPGLAKVFVTKVKTYTPSYLYIRSNGLFMFESWLGATKGKQVICELSVPSVDVLTKNRDGFREYRIRDAIGELTSRIAKDVRSALLSKSGLERTKYDGAGKFEVRHREVEVLQRLGPITPDDDGGVEIMPSAVDDIVSVTKQHELARLMISGVEFKGATHVEHAMRQLVWEPDFLLVNEIEGYRIPARFRPESMSPAIMRLVAVWTELCRFVLMQLGAREQYGVGLIFSEHTAAMYQPESREHWLLLNPYRDMRTRKHVWHPGKVDDRKWLYAAAIHECTHLADGIDYHDESFATALTLNVARTADGFRKVGALVRATKLGSTPVLRPLENPVADRRARLLSWP